jgi:carboxyl-terminal processing protease
MSFHKVGRENHRFLIPVIAAFCLIIGYLAGARFGTVPQMHTISSSSGFSPVILLNETLGFLSSKYVEPLNKDSLAEVAIQSWIKNLDPYSSYIRPEDLSWMNKRLSGSFVGIGISFNTQNDSVSVLSVLENSPAALADIRVGDILIGAGKEMKIHKGKQRAKEIIERIRGEAGTWVKVGIYRPATEKYLIKYCKRIDLDMPGVEPIINYHSSLAYIRIKTFHANTDKEFMVAMDSLFGEQRGKKDLILDLRGNQGGYLEKSTHLINQLISESGKVMVTTRSITGKETVYKTSGRPFFNPGNMVVLIDENTASAAEIVAGALQDHKRAIIIGRPSFGKGLVQEQFNLSNGGALKLTIATSFTPSGKRIQRSFKKEDSTKKIEGGIIPDIFIPYDDRENRSVWQLAVGNLPFFMMENKQNMRSDSFLSNNPLVTAFMRQNKLPEEYRDLVWQKLKEAHLKKTSGLDASMRVSFEVDPFLQAALTHLKKKEENKHLNNQR